MNAFRDDDGSIVGWRLMQKQYSLKDAANFQCALDYSHLLTVHIFFNGPAAGGK